MQRILLTLSLIVTIIYLPAQTVEEIRQDRDTYIWGEGIGATLKKADQNALSMLTNQISTTVESKYEQFTTQDRENDEYELKEKIRSVIKTYSNATLHNTERIVMSNEPDAKVFRYISRNEVDKVFEDRKNKIVNFIGLAHNAREENRIGDALRQYYWALLLLKSHPDCNAMHYTTASGQQQLLISWLPEQLKSIFNQLSFRIKDIREEANSQQITLLIHHKDKPVVNLDYSYWDDQDWGNLYGVKDGEGVLEFYGISAKNRQKVRLKVEYMYDNMVKIDDELRRVVEKIDPISWQCKYNIPLEEIKTPAALKPAPVKTNIESLESINQYNDAIARVSEAIMSRNYQQVESLFTKTGYEMFNRLIAYGNAKIMSVPDLTVYRFNDQIMCRSVRMAFNFENNYKKFVEDVVFHFNDRGKIESLSFGLNKVAYESIISNSTYGKTARLVLTNFLEHFKTAYALKRLDYIESIFAEDALIITGYVVKTKAGLESKYRNNKIVRYNRQSKQKYIRNLKYSFNSKEFINIQFEESRVRKGGASGNIYGVRIKQNYYSSNYGDTGYLFLIVDLENPQEPIIHIRTWQPDVNDTTGVYNLSEF